MNKVVTSAGLLALGAASLYGYDPEMTRAKSGRPFTVSATVRGFYDDNPTTTPDKQPAGLLPSGRTAFTEPEGSFGFEVSPSVHLSLPLDQTFLRAGYIYSLRWFDNREPNDIDQSHEFNGLLRHAFSPRHDISLADSFIVTEEPTVAERQGFVTVPTRTTGDTLRNRASLDYNVGLTRTLGLGLGYANTFYDYDDGGGIGSRSALLDRMEHLLRADARYQFNPSLVGLVGYQFGMVNYSGDDPIFFGSTEEGDVRDNNSHYVYLGADHDFSQRLRGSVRGGAQYTDYHETGESEVNPYADASLTYLYRQDSSIQAGIKHARNATDIIEPDTRGNITLDQESTAGYVQLIHRILPNLTGSVFGQVQHSTFEGGQHDGADEVIYMVGLNLEYRINRYFSAEVGYNFDLLDSDIKDPSGRYDARSYDRSRYYVGLRATY